MTDVDVFMLISKWVMGPFILVGWVMLVWYPMKERRQGKKPDDSYAVLRFMFGWMTLAYIGVFLLGPEHDFFQGFLFGLQVTLMILFLWKVVPLLRKRLRESALQAAGVSSDGQGPSGED